LIKISFRGIRSKLLIAFFLSLFVAVFCGILINSFVLDVTDVNYEDHFKYFDDECNTYAEEINYIESEHKLESVKNIKSIIEREKDFVNIYILDSDGTVIISNDKCKENSFDINALFGADKYCAHTKYDIEYTKIISLDDTKYIYFNKYLRKGDSLFLVSIVSILVFSVLFWGFTYRDISYIKELSSGLKEIAEGNLKYKVKVQGKDEISEIAENINYMSEKLFESKEEQRLAEEKKDLFIMNISHDLRTPLTSIIGYIELIKKVYSNREYEKIKDYINIVCDKSYRLNTLINDFFDYNKINFGKVKLNKTRINLNEFLRQVVTGMMTIGKEENLEISLLLPDYKINIEIDPEQMYRVMENLIMNAFKYSDCDTEIKVGTHIGNNNIVIFVENICRKFNKENIKFIFDKFYKGDASRSTKSNGAGLGLAIAKSIVKMHGGEIKAEYNENKVRIIIYL